MLLTVMLQRYFRCVPYVLRCGILPLMLSATFRTFVLPSHVCVYLGLSSSSAGVGPHGHSRRCRQVLVKTGIRSLPQITCHLRHPRWLRHPSVIQMSQARADVLFTLAILARNVVVIRSCLPISTLFCQMSLDVQRLPHLSLTFQL